MKKKKKKLINMVARAFVELITKRERELKGGLFNM